MSTPINAVISGTFSTAATLVPINISLPTGYDYFEFTNLTDFASAAAATPTMRGRGYASLPQGSAFYTPKTNGAATLGTETMTATGGFTFIADSALEPLGAAVVITAITAATPAVISSASTVVAGDMVRIYGTTAMLEVSGLDFTVTAVNPGVTQTLGFLPAAAFAAAATAGWIRKIPFDSRFYPRRRTITAISQAASAVIQMSVLHDFAVGEQVRINVPVEFGMPEIDGQLVTITAVAKTLGVGTNSITVDLDTSGYTAFAYPTSAIAAAGVSFPEVLPVGEAAKAPYGNLYDDARQNVSFSGVQIGTTILDASKSYSYIARRGLPS